MEERERNKELIEKYPWLLPRNRWTDKVDEEYDYSYTELDAIPQGWRDAFGEQMCYEIQQELNTLGEQAKTFRIMQIKEKFGYLHFYTNWYTSKLGDIISKYENLSEHTCIGCGAPATRISTGWISPWCDNCAAEIHGNTIPIEEYFSEIND